MAGDNVFLEHVVPSLGCLVAFLMFASPFKAVLQVRKQKSLGDVNPLPFVAMWANCTAWLVYAFLKGDVYVFFSNEPGLLLGAFMTVSCYGYADAKIRDHMVQGLMGFAATLTLTGGLISLVLEEEDHRVNVWGAVTVAVLLMYYGAPLSVLAQVIRTRNSAALLWPLAVMNTVNGALWVAYGLAVGDYFIWCPNLVGAVFGLVQLGLILVFPADRSMSRKNLSEPNLETVEAATYQGHPGIGERQPMVQGRESAPI